MDSQTYHKIPETTYLNTDNAGRYRAILRYFYIQHERMRHFLYPEDVYKAIKGMQGFEEYTIEQLQQDLDALVRWGNLRTRQDTGRMKTVEEFKKKRFRYQCSPYTVEIERMVQRLEQMGDTYGGSLEKTRFHRLNETLTKLLAYKQPLKENQEEIYRLWEELTDLFQKIWKNASDYTATLESDKLEEMLQSDEFLTYKETLIHYLRDFILALQRTNMKIEVTMQEISEHWIEELCEGVARYEEAIPRIDGQERTVEQWKEMIYGQFLSMKEWFLGRNGEPGESDALQRLTTDAIRRITRMVQRLGERHDQFRSRKRDYLHLAQWFEQCEVLEDAHKLSGVVFGLSHTRHLYTDGHQTENIYSDVWDEPPYELELKPRVRHYREKTKATAIQDHSKNKEQARQAYIEEVREKKELMEALVQDGKIVLGEIEHVPLRSRKMVLTWVARALGNKENIVKTEFGTRMKLTINMDKQITIYSEDGKMVMPELEFELLEETS